jgi:hypothetical protein
VEGEIFMNGTLKTIMVVLGFALIVGAVSAAGGAQVVKLVAKDTSTWVPIEGGAFGSIMYQQDKFTFNAHGLVPNGDYTLISYNDNAWAAPEVVLGNGIADKNGNILIKGGKFTLSTYDYTTGEYAGQTGAKIWLVPTSSMTGDNLNWVDWGNFLFETSLIT